MSMRQAKATSEDIDALRELLSSIEEHVEGHGSEELLVGIKRLWKGCTGWRRVVEGYSVLVENCCDPRVDHLEWRPDLKALMRT